MPSATSGHKKRKRDDHDSSDNAISITLAESNEGGPVLASFPAVKPPADTEFRKYHRKHRKVNTEEAEETILVAETDAAEFTTNRDETSRASSSGCYYLLAVHKPSTSTLKVLPTPVPPHIISAPVVKALKSPETVAGPSTVDYIQARTALGEAFGSKKAQAAIRQRERNKVDVGAMEGVVGHLMDGIEKGAEGLMSRGDMQEAADASRPIPPHNVDADSPEDVYPLNNIVPSSELKSINVSAFSQAETIQEKRDLLPWKHSDWIWSHLKHLDKQENQKRKRDDLRLLVYISTMMAFNRLISKPGAKFNRDKLQQSMPGTPANILDGLLSRFMERGRTATEYQQTSATDVLLKTYMFALCLRVDRYSTDVSSIAKDLSLPTAKANELFKALGCKIAPPSERDRKRLGLSDKAGEKKRATLVTPVTFPKPRTGKKNKR